MAVFEYTAKDSAGNEFSGVYMDVQSKSELKQELEKMGYKLLKAHSGRKASWGGRAKVRRAEVVAFAYEFAGMYAAGLSIIRCLETLESQIENPAFKDVLTDIRQHIEMGSSLKEAFEKYRHIFSEFFIGMVDAGETGGKLAETLALAAEYLEKQNELRNKVKSAFAYPVIVSIMCVIIVGALVTFVVPVFQKLYSQLHVSLPTPTLALILISKGVRGYWYVAPPLVFAVIYIYRKLSKNRLVRERIDQIKLDMPVFGRLNRMIVVSRFIRTFTMMASAGVPLVDAVRFAMQVADNSEMRRIGGIMQEKLVTGNSISSPMAQFSIFPPMIVQLAAAGEEAGILPEMLTKGVDFLDLQIDRAVKSLIMRIEPILSVVMGVVVGLILLGVYLPMFDYMAHVK